MNLKHNFLLAALLLLTTSLLYGQTAPAPTWVIVTAESTTVAVVLPAGTTYRFGDSINNKWSAPVTVTVPTTISPVSMSNSNPFPFSDPDYGTAKELDVLETSAVQTIAVTNLATSPVTTVSQLVPAVAAAGSIALTPGTTYTLTFASFANPVGTPQNAQMLAMTDMPPTDAARTWEGSQVNLSIGSVTLVCTYSTTNTDPSSVSLNCTGPVTTGAGQ